MLKPADALAIIRSTASENTVLVGGQAVMLWAAYFGLEPSRASLTSDVDFVGTSAEARRLSAAMKLPHDIAIASLDDATPNSAVLSVRLAGYEQPIIVDFLSAVAGIEADAVQKSAVTIRYEGTDLRVMHPLDCLQSKLANLHLLASKRTPEGIEQASLAVRIAAAFIERTIGESSDARQALKAIEKVASIAQGRAALYCKRHLGIDARQALPEAKIGSSRLPRKFLELRWPRLRAAMERKLGRAGGRPMTVRARPLAATPKRPPCP
jgi:hypothetical protein